MSYFEFPNTRSYDSDLGWLIKNIKQIIEDVEEQNEKIANTEAIAIELKEFVTNYFDDLDVQEEINAKIDQMANDGTLFTILNEPVEQWTTDYVANWLTTHITPSTSVVIDSSLTIAGAAADAKAAGDRITDLDNRFGEFESDSGNLWVNAFGYVNGVSFTPNGKGGIKIHGTVTADGMMRYTFENPITLNGYRLQYKQSTNDSGQMIVRCRNTSGTIVRNLPVSGYSGFSMDNDQKTIKYLDITILNAAVIDTELYISLTKTSAEVPLLPAKIVNAYNARYADFIEAPTIDIDFWGDSLTLGTGGEGSTYCNTCATILGATYRNNGHGGETANTIAARQGGNSWLIPAGGVNRTYTLADMNDIFGGKVTPLRQRANDPTAKTIYINGLAATLTRQSQSSPASDDIVYSISGYTGDSLKVPTPCKFEGSNYNAKITVIFVGVNGQKVGDDTGVNARIAIIDSMIAHLKNKNYVIMAPSNGTKSSRDSEDFEMLKHYGKNFFSTRQELVNNGLAIMSITPTADDLLYIADGVVPSSLRSDNTHLNQAGYVALGTLLASKIYSLGYAALISK